MTTYLESFQALSISTRAAFLPLSIGILRAATFSSTITWELKYLILVFLNMQWMVPMSQAWFGGLLDIWTPSKTFLFRLWLSQMLMKSILVAAWNHNVAKNSLIHFSFCFEFHILQNSVSNSRLISVKHAQVLCISAIDREEWYLQFWCYTSGADFRSRADI